MIIFPKFYNDLLFTDKVHVLTNKNDIKVFEIVMQKIKKFSKFCILKILGGRKKTFKF